MMPHNVIEQLRTYAHQLDADGRPLIELLPHGHSERLRPERRSRRFAAALAAAAFVLTLIGAIPLIVMNSKPIEDGTIESVPTSIATTVPTETPPPPTEPPRPSTESPTVTTTSLPAPPAASSPWQVGFNTMGSTPFVFVDPNGYPGSYFSSEWLYDSSNTLARCADENCGGIEYSAISLPPGSWTAVAGDGTLIRLRVEVAGDGIPRQTFGELPQDAPDQPARFAPASIALIRCDDPSCADTTRTTLLDVVDPGQVNIANAAAVPYPGGGKVFIDPDGIPWIVYSGALVDADLAHAGSATALIRCHDPGCTGTTTHVVYRGDQANEMVFNETVAFDPGGAARVAFVSADGLQMASCSAPECPSVELAPLDVDAASDPVVAVDGSGLAVVVWHHVALNQAGDPESRRVFLTRCVDEACSAVSTTQLLDLAPNFAWNLMGPSLAIAPDGNPFVTAVEWTGQEGRIHVAKCVDPACTGIQASIHTVSDVSPAGLRHVWSSAAAFGPDGVPTIAYYEGTTDPEDQSEEPEGQSEEPEGQSEALRFRVGFLKCADAICSDLVQ